MRGHARALGAHRVLGDLHHDRLAGLEHVADVAHGADLFALDVLVRAVGHDDIPRVQERVALEPNVDERRLHAGQHVLHLSVVNVADEPLRALLLDVQFDGRAVLHHGDTG